MSSVARPSARLAATLGKTTPTIAIGRKNATFANADAAP
jgi:hypothetical protein